MLKSRLSSEYGEVAYSVPWSFRVRMLMCLTNLEVIAMVAFYVHVQGTKANEKTELRSLGAKDRLVGEMAICMAGMAVPAVPFPTVHGT